MYPFAPQHIKANITFDLGGIRHIDFTLPKLDNKDLYFTVNLRCFTSLYIITPLSSLCLTSHLSLKSQCSLLHLQLKSHMSLSLTHSIRYTTYPNPLFMEHGNCSYQYMLEIFMLSAIKTIASI